MSRIRIPISHLLPQAPNLCPLVGAAPPPIDGKSSVLVASHGAPATENPGCLTGLLVAGLDLDGCSYCLIDSRSITSCSWNETKHGQTNQKRENHAAIFNVFFLSHFDQCQGFEDIGLPSLLILHFTGCVIRGLSACTRKLQREGNYGLISIIFVHVGKPT